MSVIWSILLVLIPLVMLHGLKAEYAKHLSTRKPLSIAHRGSSGMLPESTVEAFELAVTQGADYIECDVLVTRDLELVCLHDPVLSTVTNVSEVFPESRKTTHYFLGIPTLDFWVVDFDLEELKTLGVRQRSGSRDPEYDYQFQIATVEEYIMVAKNANRTVGIYPETKESIWINSLPIMADANTTFEELLVELLHNYDYTSQTDPCFLQSFYEDSIMALSNLTNLPLIQLLPSFQLYNSDTPQIDIITDELLETWAQYCYGIGLPKSFVVAVFDRKIISEDKELLDRAHEFGLDVHAYTFKNEYRDLAHDYGMDPHEEYKHFLELGIDGFFTDFPATLSRFLNSY